LRKLRSLSDLSQIIRDKKNDKKKIILANGCFDLIHVGHVRYLQEAKKLGDILIVAINSDSSVRRLKGKGRPLMPEMDRAEILASFSCVDYVIIFDEGDVNNLLDSLKPDFHAKGSDYTIETVPEKDTVRRYGGTTAITGGPKVRSTSELITAITRTLDNPDHPLNKT
jgi:rfaE bifunctional protein nucleotidyltransferase chain/domain